MRWLVCLFSYNRPKLLDNAARSIDRFFPWGDRLVVDDASTDPDIGAVLETLAAKPNWDVHVADPRSKQGLSHGGFYRNMAFALQHALNNGYDRCLFIEDDMQLVWRRDGFLDWVEEVFDTCADAIQIQPLLHRRILSYTAYEYIEPVRAYRSNRGFNTTAIWNLEVVRRQQGYKFFCEMGSDLARNSAYWLQAGYRLYLDARPTVAIIPWVASQAARPGGQAATVRSAGGDEFLLRPLTNSEVAFIENRDARVPCYQEYFDLCPGNADRPIWHQANASMQRYYELCSMVVQEERAASSSPYAIPSLPRWQPASIPPEPSHLRRLADGVPPSVSSPRPSWLKRLLSARAPAVLRAIRWLRDFRLRDWLGYLELTRRLRREQAELPYRGRFV